MRSPAGFRERIDMSKQKTSKPEKFRPFLMIASGVFLAFLISAAALIYNP